MEKKGAFRFQLRRKSDIIGYMRYPVRALLSLVGLLLLVASQAMGSNSSSILVIEGSTSTMERSSAQGEAEAVYLPVTFFESALSLERKDLAPELVGLCQDDLCIPLPLKSYEGNEYVSSRKLIEALSGAYLWDQETSQLLLDLRPQDTQDPTQGLIDFTLPDLEGRKIQLSDYRGKKVVVFAWASW